MLGWVSFLHLLHVLSGTLPWVSDSLFFSKKRAHTKLVR